MAVKVSNGKLRLATEEESHLFTAAVKARDLESLRALYKQHPKVIWAEAFLKLPKEEKIWAFDVL